MALVVLLRGMNVGGHRRFQPSALAKQLQHLGVTNIGAAGTFVVRAPVARVRLRTELTRRLPVAAEIVMCDGREVLEIASDNPFVGMRLPSDTVRFVSVLSRAPRVAPALPISFPRDDEWLLKILSRDRRFVFGLYRRHMKVISYLQGLDRIFGVPATTRNWNTVAAICRELAEVRLGR